MRDANLRNVDLNLLIAFQVLMEECNITRAARRLFISQPGMSRIVDRLQAMFNDELLVRSVHGYEPTHRALAIRKELQELLPRIETLFHAGKFDPATASGVFRVETVDWGATVLVPEVVAVLAKKAPNIEVDVVPRKGIFERLEANEIDVILTGDFPTGDLAARGLCADPLVRENWVCVMRAGHPLAKRPLTLEKYFKAQHVSLESMQEGRPHRPGRQLSMLGQFLRGLGGERDVRVRTPYFIPICPIVERTDLIATVPLHVSHWLKTPRTCIIPAPKEIPNIRVSQIWHMRNDSVPIQRWLREVIRSAAERVTSRPSASP